MVNIWFLKQLEVQMIQNFKWNKISIEAKFQINQNLLYIVQESNHICNILLSQDAPDQRDSTLSSDQQRGKGFTDIAPGEEKITDLLLSFSWFTLQEQYVFTQSGFEGFTRLISKLV